MGPERMPRDLKRELITTIANLGLCTTLLQKQRWRQETRDNPTDTKHIELINCI